MKRQWPCQMKMLFVGLFLTLSPAHLFAGNSGLETYGDIGAYSMPVLAAAIALGVKDSDKKGLFQLAASYGTTMASVNILKQVVDRERPNAENNNSFPSGHTASAFSAASFLHYRYGWQYGVPAYIAAGVVGLSRTDSNHHFVGDVIA